MPTILIAECKQEISSFNPVLSRYDDFDISVGPEVITRHRGVRSEVSGALGVFAARPDLEVVPAYSARAITSAGTLAGADFERILSEFLAAIREARRPDAIYYALHGAMAAEDEDDVEGRLLAATREIVGERTPIVVSLDLHGVLTDRMLAHADAFTMFHTYPHVDFFETGERAARLLLRILDGTARPVSAAVTIPALVRGDELITATGLLGGLVAEAQAIERGPGGLAAGIFIGNPFTDVRGLCTRTLVTTDGDGERAAREAVGLAERFWRVRERLQARLTPLDEAIRIAGETPGTTILVDAADATSSGAPGDSNAILRGLLEWGYRRRALLPLVDPPAVRAAVAAGVGATVQTALGGALDRRWEPLPVAARVRLLSDGRFRSESHGDEWYAGDTAVLEVGRITAVCTSRAVSLYDRSLFLAHGQDPTQFDLVVQKSPHCQERFYKAWAAALINVDVPGATSANLPSLGHTRCMRPMFPLDPDVAFRPEPRVFRRS